MVIACLDLEGVLFPEIWINVAEKTGINELRLTTRDISDYNELMKHRLNILKKHKINLTEIKNVISKLKPLKGAKKFFYKLKENFQVIILSDTFYQFAMPLMKQINYPVILCHNLIINNENFITDYKLRMTDAKKNSIIKLKELNFKTIACGDSYNDTTMLAEADKGILFRPPQNVINDFPQYPVTNDYDNLLNLFNNYKDYLEKV